MKPIAALGIIEGVRTLWGLKKVRDYRTRAAKSLAGDETVGRKLADEMLAELFAETGKILQHEAKILSILNDQHHRLNMIEANTVIIKNRLARRGIGAILTGSRE